ncbi:MAG TPA: thrombospondin type 3 repeat-containing protein [Polyangiaceae bacterium]|nr:thrombospondin type 3 repeat-containing protein [Polyangiaceae bacterium]
MIASQLPNAARRRGFTGAACLVLASVLATHEAHAQVSGDFAIQRFDPAAGPNNYLSTRGARIDGKMVWSVGLFANYNYLPFQVGSCEAPEGSDCSSPSATSRATAKVIENQFTGDLLGTLTPFPRLQLALKIPVSWVKGQGISADGTFAPVESRINTVGLGDPQLEAKFRVHGQVTDPFVLGLSGFVTAPLGHPTAENSYLGDMKPSAGFRVILDGAKGPFSVGANIGGAYRSTAHIGSATIGSEGRYSVAAGYRIGPVFRIIADAFGTTRFSTAAGENTLEINGGFQVMPLNSPVTISVAGGTAVVEGVGAPKFRGILGVIYAVQKRDRDDDGIEDGVDQCPTDKEDRDGNEDTDGCPDPDNDLDTVPDVTDKCPTQAEDQDNFDDRDGCPDPDNDQDGVLDVSDQCPNEPESKNGFKDDDGCPDEADKDSDGVPDARDKCPEEAEDTDGYQDTDGCPDLDNDNDGIPDAQDECIDEPENRNKFEDEDGCPDDPKAGKKKK